MSNLLQTSSSILNQVLSNWLQLLRQMLKSSCWLSTTRFHHLGEGQAPRWWQYFWPVYWFSDTERNPTWSWFAWWLRNPFANLFANIIGVSYKDRDFVCNEGDVNFASGLVFAYTITKGRPPLPYVSYRNEVFEFATGWKTHGGFSLITLRRANSPNATDRKIT